MWWTLRNFMLQKLGQYDCYIFVLLLFWLQFFCCLTTLSVHKIWNRCMKAKFTIDFWSIYTIYNIHNILCGNMNWLFGLGVWFSLRVREVPGSNPGGAQNIFYLLDKLGVASYTGQTIESTRRSYGVMVSTLDSESSDPSSNLGRTYIFLAFIVKSIISL